MVTINDETISTLTSVLESLTAPVAAPGLQSSILVSPISITPTGVGGLAGTNRDPRGEIRGRRVQAKLLVTLKADDQGKLDGGVAALHRALLGPDRATLLEKGVLRIGLDEVGPVATQGRETIREVRFNVLYEFLRRPTQAGGIIQEIPIGLALTVSDPATPGAVTAPAGAFAQGSLDWFEVFDDPQATRSRPSRWQYNAAQARIEQLSNIWGGSGDVNADKPGTYLVLRETPHRPSVADLDLTVQLSPEDDDSIGLVFRWQDVDNFYFFLMDSERTFRLLGKKVAGEFRLLDTPAVDDSAGYTVGTRYRVRINAVGPVFRVFMDGQLALQGEDSSIAAAGRVGLMARGNDQAYFYGMELAPA